MTAGTFERRARVWQGSLASAVSLATLALLGACSSDEKTEPGEPPPPTGEVTIEIAYPDATAESVTAVVHAWVLAAREGARAADEAPKFNCASLIGGTLDPYDLTLTRRADVAATEDLTEVTATQVAPGDALVYVEAAGFDGVAEFAGCTEASVGDGAVSASVELAKAKVFDCSDPDTEDDSPCDDGELCTVGETCNSGSCRGGAPRDCNFGADTCHAGTCDEETGCSVQPLADGTPCNDDLFCTQTDVCNEGECGGTFRDCTAEAPTCQIAVRCDEQLDQCVTTAASFGAPCDDSLFCTTPDQCDGFGFCQGAARDCFTGVPQCQVSAGCDETLDQCATANQTPGSFCDDGLICTELDECDGLGACTGSEVDCSGFDSECTVGVCSETLGCDASPLTGAACNVGITCTADTCNVSGSCSTSVSTRPETTSCDDGDASTATDICDDVGGCAGTPI